MESQHPPSISGESGRRRRNEVMRKWGSYLGLINVQGWVKTVKVEKSGLGQKIFMGNFKESMMARADILPLNTFSIGFLLPRHTTYVCCLTKLKSPRSTWLYFFLYDFVLKLTMQWFSHHILSLQFALLSGSHPSRSHLPSSFYPCRSYSTIIRLLVFHYPAVLLHYTKLIQHRS